MFLPSSKTTSCVRWWPCCCMTSGLKFELQFLISIDSIPLSFLHRTVFNLREEKREQTSSLEGRKEEWSMSRYETNFDIYQIKTKRQRNSTLLLDEEDK